MRGRGVIGAALVALSFLPVYRLLDAGLEAPYRQTSVAIAEATLGYVISGVALTLLAGVLLAILVPHAPVVRRARSLGARVARVGSGTWATAAGFVGGALAWLVGRFLYHGFYTNVDEIASALHARQFLEGRLSGPLPSPAEAWLIPNMMVVDAGWVSQFPPSHLVMMAVARAAGAPMLVGPILFGAMVGVGSLAFVRLLPDRPATARMAALAVAVSPFAVFIGAGALSHTSAGAFCFLALYAALRARDGGAAWSVLAGAAVGVAVCSRPWIGLVLGTLATLGVWLPAGRERFREVAGRMPWLARRMAGTVAGGAPFAAALAWYNQALFGSPTTLGYLAAFGSRHKLGFHADPWGYDYTVATALGFTSTDLMAFGTQLLETPLPVGAVVGVWCIGAARLPRGAGLLLAWALVPVVANGIYWFHSPRMLYEAAPAWLALLCLAVGSLLKPRGQADPGPEGATPPDGSRSGLLGRLTWRSVALGSLVAAGLIGVFTGIPARVSGFAWSQETLNRVTAPAVDDAANALVFVHTSWNERLSARLQGSGGMRQDTIISLLRRNTNCELQEYARARETPTGERDAPLPAVDLEQSSGAGSEILRRSGPGGTTVRVRQNEVLPAACMREFRADRFGAISLAPLIWQGDLPGAESGRPIYVRDFGPERNDSVRRAFADRTPWVLIPDPDDNPPRIAPYEEGMRLLWDGP